MTDPKLGKGFFSLAFAYMRAFLIGRAAYRWLMIGDWIAGAVGNFAFFAGIWLVTRRVSTVAGWSFAELSVLFALNLLTYSVAGSLLWGLVHLTDGWITSGDLDRFFLRPRGIITQIACEGAGHNYLPHIAMATVILVGALVSAAPSFGLAKAGFLVACLTGGIFLQAAGIIGIAALCFWLLRAADLGDVLFYQLRNFLNYPLTIFPPFLRVILASVLPWAYVNWFPSLILLDKARTPVQEGLGLASPLIGCAFFAGALALFHWGEKRYSSSGT